MFLGSMIKNYGCFPKFRHCLRITVFIVAKNLEKVKRCRGENEPRTPGENIVERVLKVGPGLEEIIDDLLDD